MAIDKKAYALANGYTDETVIGGGAIKGKNCTISKIEDIDGGHRITFGWTLDNGTTKSQTLDVKDGVDGHTPVKGVDYFDGEKGENGIAGLDGKDGKDGTTYTPSIGTVTTVDSTELASASVSVNTETKEAVFNFAIPRGNKGIDGVQISDNETVEDKTWSSSKINAKLGELREKYIFSWHNLFERWDVYTNTDLEWTFNLPTKEGYKPIGIVSNGISAEEGKISALTIYTVVQNNEIKMYVRNNSDVDVKYVTYSILLLWEKNN